MGLYPFPYMARGQTDIPGIFRNSLMMTNSSLKRMLTMLKCDSPLQMTDIIMLTRPMSNHLTFTPFLDYASM